MGRSSKTLSIILGMVFGTIGPQFAQAGCKDQSDPDTTFIYCSANTVKSFTSTLSDRTATLNWTAYTLGFKETRTETYTIIQKLNGTETTINSSPSLTGSQSVYLANDGVYEFCHQATGLSGDLQGTTDDRKVVTTGKCLSVSVISAPASITVPASNQGKFTVEWPDNTVATRYELDRLNPNGQWEKNIYAGEINSHQEPATLSEGQYQYRVRACLATQCSVDTLSSKITVTRSPIDPGDSFVPVPASYLNYSIYVGDVDSDGDTDYYFHSEPIFILIAGEIDIPMYVEGPPTYVLKYDAATKKYSDPIALHLTDEQLAAQSLKGASLNSDYFVLSDVDGNGRKDLLIPGAGNALESVVLLNHYNALPTVKRIPSSGVLTLSNAVLSITDYNADGYLDLYVELLGSQSNKYWVANGDASGELGNFTELNSKQKLIPLTDGPDEFDQPEHDVTVGAIASTFSVDSSGNSSYSIPINTPAGLGGLQPQLSLEYSSGADDGMLGVGWGLSGFSVIHRCATTLNRERYIDGVDFDDNDKFCLDGQRLISMGVGSNEYRTEYDNQTKIVASDSLDDSGGPASFTMWARDGKIIEYGTSADSKIKAHGREDVYIWALNKVKDRDDNYLTITYEQETAHTEYRPIQVNYSANTTAGVGPYNSVHFEYIPKTPEVSQHASGVAMKGTKLLKHVKTLVGSKQILDYELAYTYNSTTRQHQLTSVTQCADGHCLPATSFVWETGSHGFTQSEPWLNSTQMGGKPVFSGRGYHQSSVDINGDGRSDWVWVPEGKQSLWVSLSTGTGFTVPGGAALSATVIENKYPPRSDRPVYTSFSDFDGDGRDDMAWMPDGLGSFWVALSDGNGFSTPTMWLAHNTAEAGKSNSFEGKYDAYADVNGDGRTDKIWIPDNGGDQSQGREVNYDLYVALSNGSLFDPPQVWLEENTLDGDDPYSGADGAHTRYVDMNGDGMADFVTIPKNRHDLWVALSDGTKFGTPTQWLSSTSDGHGSKPYSSSGKHEQFVDVNGDGLPDRAWVPQGEFKLLVSINTGSDLLKPTIWLESEWPNAFSADGKHETYSDINGDGLADKVWLPEGRDDVWVAISTGTKFNTPNILMGILVGEAGAYPNSKNGDHETYGDFNGDGAPDKVWVPENKSELYVALSKPPTGKLKKATNGFGHEVEFHYSPMTDDSVYTKGNSESTSYPVQDIQSAAYVVSQMTSDNGIGGVFTTSYQYEGLQSHITGLGSFGFAKITSTDGSTGVQTIQEYNQNYKSLTHGSLDRVRTIAANGTVLSDTINKWVTTTLGSGENAYYWKNLTQTTVTKKDLNNAFLHKEVNDYTYTGNYNDLETVTSKIKNASDVVLRTTTTTTEYQDANAANWLIGLTKKVTVDIDVPGKTPAKKISAFETDPSTGRILKEKILSPEGDADSEETVLHQTSHEDIDDYGRPRRTVISGPDFVSRQSTKTFDSSGRYVASVTNDFGAQHTVTSVYYPDTHINAGMLQSATDANKITTYYQYDAFGRPTQVTRAYGSANPVSSYTSFQHCSNLRSDCPSNAVYRITRSGDGAAGSYTYIDNLGRKLRVSAQLMDGRLSLVDYTFDSDGYNTRITEPYIEGDVAQHWTSIQYDDIGRVKQTTNPEGRVDTVTRNGLTTTSNSDSLGLNQQKSETRNELGQLVSVVDNQSSIIGYLYDSLGNVTQTTDNAGNITTIVYDKLGRKTSMNDKDKGQWKYTYNGLGQLISQTNAKQQTTCMAYDTLGRMVKRIDNYQGSISRELAGYQNAKKQCAGDTGNAETAQWIYDTAPGNATGKLHQVIAPEGYGETFEYDGYGRQEYFKQTANGDSFEIDTAYDAYHRVKTTTYPGASNRLGITNVYNNLGYAVELSNAANGMPYYQATEVDARGNITGSRLGNGIKVVNEYKADSGRINNIRSFSYFDSADTPTIQDLTLTFDELGNLDARDDHLQKISETFDYDTLNRLETTSADFGNGDIRTTSITYDVLGNIKTKTGVGSYNYGGTCNNQTAGPHAVTSITGTAATSYCYDANGNMISGDGRTLSYSYFDKPTRITKGTNTSILKYNSARSLYYREDQSAAGTTKTTFVSGLYEKVVLPSNTTQERHYIGGFAVITINDRTDSSAGNVEERYLHKDHLGSTTLITDDYAKIIEHHSFDPWGKRRAPNLQSLIDQLGEWSTLDEFQKNNLMIPASLLASSVTNKGFTGHEQLDGVGLIHMGGRVYDANIGRFVSADPFVQDAKNLQALNRYSYVQNNPLSFTDPTGYFIEKIAHAARRIGPAETKRHVMKHVRAFQKRRKSEGKFFNNNPALQTVASVVISVWCPLCAPIVAYVNMGISASRTYAAGGSFRDMAKGAAIAFAASYAGGAISAVADTYQAAVGQMLIQGMVSKASGGKFIDGVIGAAAVMAVSAAIKWAITPSDGYTTEWGHGGEVCDGGECRPMNKEEYSQIFGRTVAQVERSSWSFQIINSLKTTWAWGAEASAAPNLIIDVSADGIFYQRSATTGIGAALPEFSIVGELGLAFAPGGTPEARLGNFMGNGSDLNVGLGEAVLIGGNLLLIGNPSNPNNFDIVGGSIEVGIGVGITPITGGVEINSTHHSGPVNSIIDFRGN